MSSIEINNGPSKFDLMHALFVRKPDPQKLVFVVEKEHQVKCEILSVEAEDNSGESWNITGYSGNKRFTGYYRTDKRIGTFRLAD